MDVERFVFYIIIFCASVLIISGNCFVLTALRKAKSLHNITRFLLANLAVCDILFGFSIGLNSILRFTSIQEGACISMSIANGSAGACMSGVLLLCLQSFLCMRFPVRFKTGFSKRIATILVSVSWILWFCHAVYGYTHGLHRELDGMCIALSRKNDYIWMGLFGYVGDMHIVVLIVLQVASLVMIYQRNRQLKVQARNSRAESSSSAEPARQIKRLKKFSKMVSIITMVLVLFVISYGPFFVGLSVLVVCPEDSCKKLEDNLLIAMIAILNSLGNVFIYWKKSDEFRDALSNICQCRQRIGIAVNVEGLQME